MKALFRFRIILFAFSVFGAFANFAQNQWGITVIQMCHATLALSFLLEALLIFGLRIRLRQLPFLNTCFLILTSCVPVIFILLAVSKSGNTGTVLSVLAILLASSLLI